MKPWLSVIIPVHEGSKYLRATLASAMAERPDGVEFLLYDSSEDDGQCRRITEDYVGQTNLRYIAAHEMRAWTAKTNQGALDAQAPYLVMLHQDDLWMPGHLAAIRLALTRSPHAVMSIASSRFVDDRGKDKGQWRLPFRPGQYAGTEVARKLIVQNTIAIPSPVILRDAWLAVGGLEDSLWYTADWDLYLKLAHMGEVDIRPSVTTAFRIHRGSLTMTGSRDPRDFAAQHYAVLDRHLFQLPADVRRRQEPLARASVAVNCALAGRSARNGPRVRDALGKLFQLRPNALGRFFAETRLIDRVLPRLRLHFAKGT